MPAEIQFVRCSRCGADIDELPSSDPGKRLGCPTCGSTGRKFGVGIQAEITPRGMLGFKAKASGGRRPFIEGKVGSDLYRKTGRWMRLERVIDRAQDWYREHISDRETGAVTRHVEEPLSKHSGHGAAKRPPKVVPPDV